MTLDAEDLAALRDLIAPGPLLTAATAAAYLRVSERTFYAWALAGFPNPFRD